MNINHGEFEDFMFREPAVNDFKCEALSTEGLDILRVSIELKRGTEPPSAVEHVRARIGHTFELTADVVVLDPGTLAKEFEGSIKAPRIIDRRT